MNNKITSIAAALVAKAGTNASAGIGIKATLPDTSIDTKKRLTNCMNNSLAAEEVNEQIQHQIGTNLADLSVCWHKTTWPEHCIKCGEPFYKANQSSCEKCNDCEENFVAGTLKNSLSAISSESSLLNFNSTLSQHDSLVKNLPSVEYITRKNFEDEFSSLIINSTKNSSEFMTSFNVNKKIDLSSQTKMTKNDLIEQIKLYNKYNSSTFTELKFEQKEELLLINGLLKIHWNLKQPIQLSISNTSSNTFDDQSLSSNKSDMQTDFKATLLNDDLKQSSFDDSSLDTKAFNKSSSQYGRSHTVKYKPTKWKRPALQNSFDSKNIQKVENETQKFIPAYASVSSIRIDNQITCQKAIQILLDKYHIINPTNSYSLYKCYQSGETRELNDYDNPLIERIWMGPFNEDKIFIMEKGLRLNKNQTVSNLVCLPLPLLQGLLENLNNEEAKEINNIKENFLKYEDFLKRELARIDEAENVVTTCSM